MSRDISHSVSRDDEANAPAPVRWPEEAAAEDQATQEKDTCPSKSCEQPLKPGAPSEDD